MRFRLGLAIGFAAGYVLGSKAGEERYEQILELAGKVRASQPAQELEHGLREAADSARAEFETFANEKAGEVVSLARETADRVREQAEEAAEQAAEEARDAAERARDAAP